MAATQGCAEADGRPPRRDAPNPSCDSRQRQLHGAAIDEAERWFRGEAG